MSLGTNWNWNIGMVTSLSNISIYLSIYSFNYLSIGWSSDSWGGLASKKFSTGRKNPKSLSYCTSTAKDLLDSADGCPISSCLILASGSLLCGLLMSLCGDGVYKLWRLLPLISNTQWQNTIRSETVEKLFVASLYCLTVEWCASMIWAVLIWRVLNKTVTSSNMMIGPTSSLVTSSIWNHNKRWCSKLKHSLHVLIWVTYKTQQKQGDKVQPSTAVAPNDSDLAQAPSTHHPGPPRRRDNHGIFGPGRFCASVYIDI